MHIEINYEGKTYKSKEREDASQKQSVDTFWPEFENLDKIQLELESGGVLMMGKEAAQRCTMIIYP